MSVAMLPTLGRCRYRRATRPCWSTAVACFSSMIEAGVPRYRTTSCSASDCSRASALTQATPSIPDAVACVRVAGPASGPDRSTRPPRAEGTCRVRIALRMTARLLGDYDVSGTRQTAHRRRAQQQANDRVQGEHRERAGDDAGGAKGDAEPEPEGEAGGDARQADQQVAAPGRTAPDPPEQEGGHQLRGELRGRW